MKSMILAMNIITNAANAKSVALFCQAITDWRIELIGEELREEKELVEEVECGQMSL